MERQYDTLTEEFIEDDRPVKLPRQPVVSIDGIDIGSKVRRIVLNEAGDVSIELDVRFKSENGAVHRHLKGLQKAKD